MKRLKLRALELGAQDLLSREQLKNVLGGSGSGSGDGIECGSCNSHPGYTCARQSTSTGAYCMCGAASNYWYC